MPKFGARAQHHFFELMDVPADIAAVLGQIQDRIADDLAGTVVGDVAATVAGMEFDVHLFEQAVPDAQMIAGSISPERDHVRMLAKKQHVGNRARFARLDELALQFARGAVGD